jgi:hypothetical protein
MPRFFFNIHYQVERRDTEGLDLPDADAAWREATMAAGELFKEISGQFSLGDEWQLKVTDEQGKLLHIVRITAVKM